MAREGQIETKQVTESLNTQFKLLVWSASDTGLRRPKNEDSTLALHFTTCFGATRINARIFAVADGMGGNQAGDVASRSALATLASFVPKRLSEIVNHDADTHLKLLEDAFEEANRTILEAHTAAGREGMGTTLTVAFTVDRILYVGNVGDSRCYLLRDGQITRATRDDSVVQEMIEAGQITEQDARIHPRRNEVTNALGVFGPEQFKARIGYVGDLLDYDYILLSSDGLHGVVEDHEIGRILQTRKDVASSAKALVALAMERGGPDNISVVLSRIVKAPQKK